MADERTVSVEEAINDLLLALLRAFPATIAEKREANEVARPKVSNLRAAIEREKRIAVKHELLGLALTVEKISRDSLVDPVSAIVNAVASRAAAADKEAGDE